jgi:hypothetical protein
MVAPVFVIGVRKSTACPSDRRGCHSSESSNKGNLCTCDDSDSNTQGYAGSSAHADADGAGHPDP